MKTHKIIKMLSLTIILLTVITTLFGLFYNDSGAPFYKENVFGEKVKLYGSGLYKHESFFKTPILLGTDTIILFLVTPIFLLLTLKLNVNSNKSKLLHISFLICIFYYSLGLSFGVTINILCPIYILLTSLCLLALIIEIINIDLISLASNVKSGMNYKSIGVFLIIAGISVFVWFMDIISFIKHGAIPASLGMHTNEVTYVIDIGFIAPTAFIAAYSMFKRKPLGYLLSPLLLVLNALIGIIVMSQTVFQRFFKIDIPIQAQIAYVGIFVVMSLFASFFSFKFFRNIES